MSEDKDTRGRRAAAFDVRLVIAALFVLYGVVCTLMGLFGTSAEEIDRAAGININLWSGVGMLVFSAAFTAWARLRPIVVPTETGTPET
ncbi:hypothetical protein [Actinopolyspora mortivallis]|uniref:hypothetical protein n=1 Tax=Actinopolyspora mortivallis TaxID=33906 RepID=UPI00035CFEC0|nr:hypothetical protein [Actinopolyspora mortivallis]